MARAGKRTYVPPCDPAIFHLGIHPKDALQKAWMTHASFILAKSWKSPQILTKYGNAHNAVRSNCKRK